jgi:Tfp pilus assembly protein PilX
MSLRERLRHLRSQRGVSLVEQVMAAFFIGFLVLVWVNSIRATTKGTLMSKNNLRAQNLGLSKLEDVKNAALQATYGRTWDSVTKSATVTAYQTPQVARIENKAFTWRVLTDFAALSNTADATPVVQTTTSQTLWMRAEVSWMDISGPKVLTMTGYATDVR